MNKFTFKHEWKKEQEFYSSPTSSTTVEIEAEALEDVLQAFEQFLRGSGFYFEGTLDIVPFDDNTSESE